MNFEGLESFCFRKNFLFKSIFIGLKAKDFPKLQSWLKITAQNACIQYTNHPIPWTCKWLKHVLKLLVCILMLDRLVLVPISNISKICGQKFEEIKNSRKNSILKGIFCSSKCLHPAVANSKLFFLQICKDDWNTECEYSWSVK